MIPMRYARHNDAVNVGEYLFHRFGRHRSTWWQLRRNISGRNLRQHGVLADITHIVGRPVDQLMTIFTEFFGWHIAELKFGRPGFLFTCHKWNLSKTNPRSTRRNTKPEQLNLI